MGVLINIILLLVFQRINPFLTLSMVVKHVDDCIKKIELDDDTNLYTRENIICSYADGFNLDYDIPIFPPIPYELGQKIKILIGDKGQNCSLKMEIKVNDNIIKDNDIQFWTCENCNNFGFNYDNNILNCYPPGTNDVQNDYNFFFEISSLAQLDFNTSEYSYYLNYAKNNYISVPDFNEAIDIINLNSENVLFANNSEGNVIAPFYKYIYYKISFDEFKTHKGKFIGSDESNNDLVLGGNTYSRITENKNLRYELSNEEKNNRGAFIRFKLGIYNNQKKLISELYNFNILICLQEYISCKNDRTSCTCEFNESEINEDYLNGKSYIKLIVKGTGINKVFYAKDQTFPSAFIPPNEVIINNRIKSYVLYEYELDKENNDVILIWTKHINTLHTAFYHCNKITHADLSHFYSSSLTSLGGLFQECHSLKYVNFTNFNTEKVWTMQFMFRNCISLTSLDLSGFNTKLVKDMKYMFHDCHNLHYLNLKNFEQNDLLDYTKIFEGIQNNIIVCINNAKAPDLFQLINNFDNSFIDCSVDWFARNNILHYSYISLKVKGKGINKIFYGKDAEYACSYFIPPDEVIINSIKQNYVHYEYNFEQDENEVILIWYNKINYLGCAFYKSTNITFVDLSNFNSTLVTDIHSMFDSCKSLVYINFTNFETSECTSMKYMFSYSTSLISLDLSGFDTKKLTSIQGMFQGCTSLKYINLINFQLKENLDYSNTISRIPKNVIVCIDQTKASDLYQLIVDLNCNNIYCSDDWYIHQKKLIDGENECIDDCNNTQSKKNEFDNKCYDICPYGTFYDENNMIEKCKCEFEKCYSCIDVEPIKNLCITCNKSFYPMGNDIMNIGPYINCYKNPIGYYLDETDVNNYIYKLCYEKCESCEKKGDELNNNCLECKSEYPFKISNNNYFNCYSNCTYYYYIDENGNKICTDDFLCPEEYNKLILNERECTKNCELNNIYKYEFRNKCYSQCPIESKESIEKEYFCEVICNEENPFVNIEIQECVEFCDINEFTKTCKMGYIGNIYEENEQNITGGNYGKIEEIKKAQEIKAQDAILKNFEKGFTSENYNTSELDIGNDYITKTEKMIITLTTTDNQKNNNNKSDTSSKVDIGQCEDILRRVYNISEEEKLYMKKIDVIQEGIQIPKIEFDLYSKLNGTNLIKLNKSYCADVKMELSVYVILTDDIDKLNTSSGYYTDICYTSTSDSGTDILLKDRKNEFINSNKAVCQDGCVFIKYDYNTSKALCSCDIKETSSSFALMNINKEKFFENFIDIKNIANINILKCYKTLFSKKGINRNFGFLIVSVIIILHFILVLLLLNINLNIIKTMIKNIIFGITNWKFVKEDENKKKIQNKNYNEKIKKININKLNKEKKSINNIAPDKLKFKLKNKHVNPPKKLKRKNKTIIINNHLNLYQNNNIYNNMDKSIIANSKIELSKKESIIEKTKEIMKYTDEELNQLSYDLALKYDNRTYCEYYISLIKTKHNLIFSFFYNQDFNSRLIKIDLFFIGFLLELTINALFFNDDTMHKIYEDKGNFDFLYQLPQILYSSIISYALDSVLKSLALSEDYILDLKQNKTKKNLKEIHAKLYKKLKILLFLFFIICLIFLLSFLYYVSMFCAIYKNTQIHLIKDTLIGFGTSLLYPFGIYLLPGFFRIPAISNKHNKRKILYTISKIFHMI